MGAPCRPLLTCSLLLLQLNGAHSQPRRDWYIEGQDQLSEALRVRPKLAAAKNVIVFIGGGLGFSTITSSRIYNAQKNDRNFWEARLAFDKFPYSGTTLAYSVDQMVSDSAASTTALLTGARTRVGVIGLNQNVYRGRCDLAQGNELKSVLKYANEAGKRTGIVTTARITHSTPATTYANTADKSWESDGDLPQRYKTMCKDIARQLIDDNNYINVLLGGGREQMLPSTVRDPEYSDTRWGKRQDGQNLIKEWKNIMDQKYRPDQYKYVEKLDEFDNVDPDKVEQLLGLFESCHMHYEVDRLNRSKNPWPEPSLAEMTDKAIQILEKGDDGYFLLIESARIDMAHHNNNAFRALNDTLAFSQAIQKAVDMTADNDTLILVTSDHSQVFTMAGYSAIDSDIFGLSTAINGAQPDLALDLDGLPYTTLGYANGPSYSYHRNNTDTPGSRRNLTGEDTADVDYLQPSTLPLKEETHGGEDVPLYGRGPLSHLVTGTHEQTHVAHLIMYASCIGPQGTRKFCNEKPGYKDWPRDPKFVDPATIKSGAGQFKQFPAVLWSLSLLIAIFCM